MNKKTWLITGTSTGFGKELAIYLAQKENVNLVATARNTDSLSYLEEYDKGQILIGTLDVTNETDIQEVVKRTIEKFGRIDVLVNNAGIGYFGTFEESNIEKVKYMFDVNIWGLVDMTRTVLPIMRKQKSGTIISFSSVGGFVSFPTLSFYHGTKYAVEGLMDSLAQEVADCNIKVMTVEPSGFRTDWAGRSSDKAIPQIEDYKQYASFIEGNENGAGHEAGDPKAVAEIIYNQIENNYANLPSNLPLGAFAVTKSLEKFERLTNLFNELGEIGKSADRPE